RLRPPRRYRFGGWPVRIAVLAAALAIVLVFAEQRNRWVGGGTRQATDDADFKARVAETGAGVRAAYAAIENLKARKAAQHAAVAQAEARARRPAAGRSSACPGAEHQHRTARRGIGVAGLDRGRLVAVVGVDQQLPIAAVRNLRQGELDAVVPGIEDDQQRRILAALADAARPGAAVEQHAKAAGVAVLPTLLGHLGPGRIEPGDVADAELLVEIASQETAAAEDRVPVPKLGELFDEGDQRLAALADVPVDPADLVVLAIGVVVAALGAGKLVAGEQHRGALAEQQRRQDVPPLAVAQRLDLGIVGRAHGSAIPAAIVG